MEWISFHGPRRPINGQKIIYYGEAIGVWRGGCRGRRGVRGVAHGECGGVAE